jgi:hypothetical protein
MIVAWRLIRLVTASSTEIQNLVVARWAAGNGFAAGWSRLRGPRGWPPSRRAGYRLPAWLLPNNARDEPWPDAD